MAEKKVTQMKLKVDLQCDKCHKKVKNVLCQFPQIRDQVYDQKNNIVTITVVCCSPEKIRDKLCCKGCGVIKCIEIVEPPKKTPPPPTSGSKSSPPPPPPPECKSSPPPSPPPPECKHSPPVCLCPPQPRVCLCPPARWPPPPVCLCPPTLPPLCLCPPTPPPVCLCPPARLPAMVPIGACCVQCSEGRPGGPCFHEHDGPRPCYDGYCRRPVYDSYAGGRPCYLSRCGEYLSEENTSGCMII